MGPFNNSVLIILFNYADCAHHKDFLQSLYGPFFKKIIFYSDLPKNGVYLDGVHYVYIRMGSIAQNIFDHYRQNYPDLINESDGLFYTMDDNIINLRILDQFNTDKIIFEHHFPIGKIEDKADWHWDWDNGKWGKRAIYELQKDEKYSKYEIEGYTGAWADSFYLPKKYLKNELFELFELFAKYEVFIEIAIPTILHHIEKRRDHYQPSKHIVLWGQERLKLREKTSFYEIFSGDSLFVHPVKFNENPKSKEWLVDIFANK